RRVGAGRNARGDGSDSRTAGAAAARQADRRALPPRNAQRDGCRLPARGRPPARAQRARRHRSLERGGGRASAALLTMATGLAIALAAAAALWAQREGRAAWRSRRFRRRFPGGADGVILGAEARTYVGDPHRALLLVHGYNDSPASLDDVARALHAAGWTVRLPLLPGHGRSLEAWDAWTGADAVATVRAEYA